MQFRVVGLSGAVARKEISLDSPIVSDIPKDTLVEVIEIRGRRAHIISPVDGWASVITEKGYAILKREEEEPPQTVSTDESPVDGRGQILTSNQAQATRSLDVSPKIDGEEQATRSLDVSPKIDGEEQATRSLDVSPKIDGEEQAKPDSLI